MKNSNNTGTYKMNNNKNNISPLKNKYRPPKLSEVQKNFGVFRPVRGFRRFGKSIVADTGEDPNRAYVEFLNKDIIKPLYRPAPTEPQYVPDNPLKWTVGCTKKCNSPELLPKVEDEKKRLYNQLKEATQGQNIYELTSSINTMLSNFLEQCSLNKINQLKNYFMENFNLLFRKKHFIDAIDIDTNFNISVYRNRTYSFGDLEKLLNNLGEAEFAKSIGPNSLELLKEHFSLSDTATIKDIQIQLQGLVFFGETINLQERVNLQQLSKGEKQIYVLSLYWALIKLSAHEVPFVIDTPYARIDTEHRENITKEFLPHIGHQVIVLSTNEEINENYYSMLKPHIAQEYLLVFDTKQKKTEIYNKYFYEV